MDRKIILGVLTATCIALIIALFLPGGKSPDIKPKLPWLIENDNNGTTRVFDLTLGKSSLIDAKQIFAAEGKANIFASDDDRLTLEAYFDRIYLSGIKADVVLSLSLPNDQLSSIFQRGIRISQLGDGTKKVTISPDDMSLVNKALIERITYLPAAKLDQELVRKRFGKPDSIIKEESGIEHWLYPEKGLDIAINPDGKEILQYVKPADFNLVSEPLLKSQ